MHIQRIHNVELGASSISPSCIQLISERWQRNMRNYFHVLCNHILVSHFPSKMLVLSCKLQLKYCIWNDTLNFCSALWDFPDFVQNFSLENLSEIATNLWDGLARMNAMIYHGPSWRRQNVHLQKNARYHIAQCALNQLVALYSDTPMFWHTYVPTAGAQPKCWHWSQLQRVFAAACISYKISYFSLFSPNIKILLPVHTDITIRTHFPPN